MAYFSIVTHDDLLFTDTIRFPADNRRHAFYVSNLGGGNFYFAFGDTIDANAFTFHLFPGDELLVNMRDFGGIVKGPIILLSSGFPTCMVTFQILCS